MFWSSKIGTIFLMWSFIFSPSASVPIAKSYNMLTLRVIYMGSYTSAHVLLNLLNELRKRDKMRGLPSILSPFRDKFNKFNKTRAPMLDSIYHMTFSLLLA